MTSTCIHSQLDYLLLIIIGPGSSSELSVGQVVGIAVGTVIGVAVLLVAILIATVIVVLVLRYRYNK